MVTDTWTSWGLFLYTVLLNNKILHRGYISSGCGADVVRGHIMWQIVPITYSHNWLQHFLGKALYEVPVCRQIWIDLNATICSFWTHSNSHTEVTHALSPSVFISRLLKPSQESHQICQIEIMFDTCSSDVSEQKLTPQWLFSYYSSLSEMAFALNCSATVPNSISDAAKATCVRSKTFSLIYPFGFYLTLFAPKFGRVEQCHRLDSWYRCKIWRDFPLLTVLPSVITNEKFSVDITWRIIWKIS